MIGLLRLLFRACFVVAIILLITCLMTVTSFFRARNATRTIMQTAFKVGSAICGIRVHILGTLARERPLIVASNHFTYLDMFVLGSIMPAAFTPKSEIRSWPVVGFMCKVSGCLFIDRHRTRTLDNKNMLLDALHAGEIISLFPEGTTSDGTGLLPFKSSFFALAEETGICLQPISIVYTRINGRRVTQKDYPVIGWYGDSYFFPHVMGFLRQQSLEATLVFHAPVATRDYPSRKVLASHCRDVIQQGIREMQNART